MRLFGSAFPLRPKVASIIDTSYVTIEAERLTPEGARELLHWTSHYCLDGIHQRHYWTPAALPRPDGFSCLAKTGDEAIVFMLKTEDGQDGCAIYPADPKWTKEEMWKHIKSMQESLLRNDSISLDPAPQAT